MAIITGLCSAPNQSPTLPALSLPTVTSLKTLQLHPSKSACILNLISNDALIIAAAAEAVTLAREAAMAAREAVAAEKAARIGEVVWGCKEACNESNGLSIRRKNRRKKRRKPLELLGINEEKRCIFDIKKISVLKTMKKGYLSSIEEAECCYNLKVR